MRRLHVLCVAFERPIHLMNICGLFLTQTNPNWTLTIMYDGPIPDHIKNIMSLFGDSRIKFRNTEKVNGYWGHPNRKKMLQELKGRKDDFVLLTNEDNIYVPVYVDAILSTIKKDTGIIMTNALHSYTNYSVFESELKENHIDMGAFAVRLDIAKKVGFNHINFSADGKYAEECGEYCVKKRFGILKIKQSLFIHC